MAGTLIRGTNLIGLTRSRRWVHCLSAAAAMCGLGLPQASAQQAVPMNVTAPTPQVTTLSGAVANSEVPSTATFPELPSNTFPTVAAQQSHQVYPAMPADAWAAMPGYAYPATGVYDPNIAYAQPAYFQPGAPMAVPTISQGTMIGDTSVQVFGQPDYYDPSLGGSAYRRMAQGILREAQIMATTNDSQTLYSGGLTIALLETEGFAIGGRGMFNGADFRGVLGEEYGFSGDLWGGGKMGEAFGEHWLKVGGFVDWQDQFYKAGPMLSALLFANERFPFTVDAAVGFGDGDGQTIFNTQQLVEIADRDYQVRAGVFLTPNLQVGASGNYYEWDAPTITDEYGGGGFVTMYAGNMRFTVDFTHGEGSLQSGNGEQRAYATMAYTFGNPSDRVCYNCRAGSPWCIDGQTWMMQPVQRDVSMRFGLRQGPFVGNITRVFGTLFSPPRFFDPALGTADNDGIIEPGEAFELDVSVVNGTDRVANNVAVFNVVQITGPATSPGGVTGQNLGSVAPGQTVSTGSLRDLDLRVNANATPGQTISVIFSVTSDGQTRNFVIGPIVVGQSVNGQQLNARLAN